MTEHHYRGRNEVLAAVARRTRTEALAEYAELAGATAS